MDNDKVQEGECSNEGDERTAGSSSQEKSGLNLQDIPLVHTKTSKPDWPFFHGFFSSFRNESGDIYLGSCSRFFDCQDPFHIFFNSKDCTDVEDSKHWLVGSSKTPNLQFRCVALSSPPVAAPAADLHMTYKTVQAETKLLCAVLNSHGFREVPVNILDYNILWTGVHPKPNLLKDMLPYQRVNHFPRSFELTRKDRLYKNIEKLQMAKGAKHFDFIPQTYVMPHDYRELCTMHHRNRGPWIVKPVASSRGRGIYIINNPEQVPLEESVVVAKYIDNPLLVDGHKCDLRLYVAVTSYNPLLVYLYEEGLVRFATVKYDTSGKHLWNPCMHLCNYSINKYHSDYIKSDDPEAEDVGHKWTLSALLRHLKSEGIDTSLLMQRIEEVVVKAILAAAPPIVAACKMFVPHSHNCFELYGFDILVDSNLKPWLLEVNLSPSLGCDSPLDIRVKSAMLVDLLTLVGIPAVDPMLRKVNDNRRVGGLDVSKKCRVQSADTLTTTAAKKVAVPTRLTSSTLSLTPEESRVVRSARAEFDRRGGFVRIFPSSESWRRYSSFLDPVTGITCSGHSVSVGHPCSLVVIARNYNLLLHQQLFPNLQHPVPPQVAKSLVVLPDRLARYERALVQGHRTILEENQQEGTGSGMVTKALRREMLASLKKGNKLSQNQARKIFCQYLQCVLRRLTSKEEDDVNSDLIMRFLQKASTNLRTPYFVQLPSRKLSSKDRIAVVAKQLSDFIYLYSRETDLYTEPCERPHSVPNSLCNKFLAVAQEEDLEEVLTSHSQLYKCVHTYLGRCGPAPAATTHPLSLLRSFPPPSGTCEGRDSRTKKSRRNGGENVNSLLCELGISQKKTLWTILR